MFIYKISLKTQVSIYAGKNHVCLQFLTSLVVRVISFSYTIFQQLSVCGLNPIYVANVSIEKREQVLLYKTFLFRTFRAKSHHQL